MPDVLAPTARAPRGPRNGVNTPALLATINAVRETPALAKFQFRATNRWVGGTCSETTIESFSGAGGEHKHAADFRYQADHPAVLVGADRAPTPVEFLLGCRGRVCGFLFSRSGANGRQHQKESGCERVLQPHAVIS